MRTLSRLNPTRFMVKQRLNGFLDGIPVPNFQIVSPAGLLTSQEYFASLEQVIGFPMVLKPIHGVSGAGVIKINDATEMYSWLKLNCNVHMTYLAEEALKGVECVLLALVNKSKNARVNMAASNYWVFGLKSRGYITEGSPVAVVPLPVASPLNERLHAFGSEIVNSLNNARLNSIVVLRIMYLPNEDTFKFSKISCRIPNPLCCEAFEINCGISPETVHIATQIGDVDIASWEMVDPKMHFGLVSYPCRQGTLAYVPHLEKFSLKSNFKLIQAVALGQRMEKPDHINDVCLTVQLWNENFADLRADVQKLCNEFKPEIRWNGFLQHPDPDTIQSKKYIRPIPANWAIKGANMPFETFEQDFLFQFGQFSSDYVSI
uniref:ATP-grasp domain-containing protein n=1 Tax=Romanomermis culicivorax TaxID=13658 RepID=A0A915JPD5_ROMCU